MTTSEQFEKWVSEPPQNYKDTAIEGHGKHAGQYADVLVQISLEAYEEGRRAGLREAAAIVTKYAVDIGRTPVNGMRHLHGDGHGTRDEVRKTYSRAILALIEKKDS